MLDTRLLTDLCRVKPKTLYQICYLQFILNYLSFPSFSENLKFTHEKKVLMSQNKLFNEIGMVTNLTCCDFWIFFWSLECSDTGLCWISCWWLFYPSLVFLVSWTFVPGFCWISCQWLFYSVVLCLVFLVSGDF